MTSSQKTPSEAIAKKVVRAAKDAGLEHFLLAFVDSGTFTYTHLEAMQMGAVSRVAIQLILSVLQHEQATPTNNQATRAAFVEYERDFKELITRHNLKIDGLKGDRDTAPQTRTK